MENIDVLIVSVVGRLYYVYVKRDQKDLVD